MSSFKRRLPASSGPLPTGVRASAFSSPVPLLSTGVPAIDDLLSGGGISSGALFLLVPSIGTGVSTAASAGAGPGPSARATEDEAARTAAEPYAELMLAYGVAQGIAAKQTGVVIGEDADGFVQGLMGKAGDEEPDSRSGTSSATSEQTNAPFSNAAADAPSQMLGAGGMDEEGEESAQTNAKGSAKSEKDIKIAWRYENMKQFKTTVDDPRSTDGQGKCGSYHIRVCFLCVASASPLL